MKMLVTRTPIAAADPFELADLKAQIRVDADEENEAIKTMGRTAAAQLEHFAQIALLTQTIHVTIFDPAPQSGLRLPIGPVADGDAPAVTIDSAAFSAFDFVGGNRPYIRWRDSYHALTPRQVEVEYQAGFGIAASDVPADLSQALMDQAALLYDGRSNWTDKLFGTSPHLAVIGARYRGVQL
ncbi:hypothetical protein EU805_09115 [Salipiger sp. IMCC34102]|uniref:head-tail connector protein n=1 Tax=Salipiger sp. IMCC34102 TaxID=2510647 RepID=UPI00101DA11C|nr:hypothetical protein [Salipiger sp. IMCC34102]RYH02754.1 hypothetical protein EU805_09115 [Salipiger sp. IMCC34102]